MIFNLPAHFEESNTEHLVTRSAAILWPSSVRAWGRVEGVGQPIVCVGASDFVGAVSTPAVVFPGNGRVSVSFPGGPSTVADPDHDHLADVPGGCTFAWPPPVLRGRRFTSYVFDGTRLERLEFAGGEWSGELPTAGPQHDNRLDRLLRPTLQGTSRGTERGF